MQADSPPLPGPQTQSNLQQLLARPGTLLLLACLLATAYLLWARRVEVSAVAFSYDAVVAGREYWRALTASFAHFEMMHLAFNCMSLYQLGEHWSTVLSLSFCPALCIYLSLSCHVCLSCLFVSLSCLYGLCPVSLCPGCLSHRAAAMSICLCPSLSVPVCPPGELEEVYGSVAFLYLNLSLVAITMALCVLLYHLLITRRGMTQLVHQQAVG